MNKVRRLALDINPWVRVYFAFLILVVFVLDMDWIISKGRFVTLMPGLMLYIGAAFTAQKVALWRLLPVSRTDIDRARWWQGIAGAGALLFAGLTIPTLVLNSLNRVHPAWPQILQMFLAQWGLCVLLVVGMSIIFPIFARRIGRSAGLLLIPVFLAPIKIAMPLPAPDEALVLQTLAVIGPLGAVALYAAAGRWPAPLTTAIWSMPQHGRATTATATARTHLRGWPQLMLANLRILAPLWLLIAAFPPVMSWIMGKGGAAPSVPIILFATMPVSINAFTTGMRGLRALPLSGGRLLTVTTGMLALYQAISVLAFDLGMMLANGAPLSLPLAATILSLTLLYFPYTLHFGLRVSQMSYALVFLLAIPFQLLAKDPLLHIAIIAMVQVLAAVSLVWTYWEITHGHRAWRVQSVTPARWHGV